MEYSYKPTLAETLKLNAKEKEMTNLNLMPEGHRLATVGDLAKLESSITKTIESMSIDKILETMPVHEIADFAKKLIEDYSLDIDDLQLANEDVLESIPESEIILHLLQERCVSEHELLEEADPDVVKEWLESEHSYKCFNPNDKVTIRNVEIEVDVADLEDF